MGAMALVLDRLWLEMGRVEMRAATEASALAAARELASDDLLRVNPNPNTRLDAARVKAGLISQQNLVVGQPLVLNTSPSQDVRLGVLNANTDPQLTQFQETSNSPTTAVVIGRRTRSRNNPVALFIQGISSADAADLVVTSEASIQNLVVGLRPLNGLTVPTFPLGILRVDPTGQRTDTWEAQIEQRLGKDEWTWDPEGHMVVSGPDGIPEIVLNIPLTDSGGTSPNACFLPLANKKIEDVSRTILQGWSETDLVPLAGVVPVAGQSWSTLGMFIGRADFQEALNQKLGECRALFLYDVPANPIESGTALITCTRTVAGRVMVVSALSQQTLQIVIQPGVLETRTALLASETGATTTVSNPYIYKISLTH